MTSEGILSNFRTVGQSVFLYESHMYSFATMISDNTSIRKADLAVGFPYRFDSRK